MGIGTIERAQMAVDRMFNLTGEDMLAMSRMERLDHQPFFDDPILRSKQDLEGFDDVPTFSGLREMYDFFTGDHEVTGRFNRKNLPPDMRSSMDITSATFSYILGNTMGRRLVKDYREINYQEALLISTRKPAKDFRQQEAVNVGYFGDLDTVDPETADYEEIAAVTDEESHLHDRTEREHCDGHPQNDHQRRYVTDRPRAEPVGPGGPPDPRAVCVEFFHQTTAPALTERPGLPAGTATWALPLCRTARPTPPILPWQK